MNKIKRLRKDAGITSIELSNYTGIDRGIISLLENGKRPLRQEHIDILCDFFNVSTDYLLGKDEYGIRIYDTDQQELTISKAEYESLKPNIEISVSKISDKPIAVKTKYKTYYLGGYSVMRLIINESLFAKKVLKTKYIELGEILTEEQLEKTINFIKEYILK